jgi:hypothetical protein
VARMVGFCCGCSSQDDHFERTMRSLNISEIIKIRLEDCISSGLGSVENKKRCISTESDLDEELKVALTSALEQASKPDDSFRECQRQTLLRGKCKLKENWDEEEDKRVRACREGLPKTDPGPGSVPLFCCNGYGIRVCQIIMGNGVLGTTCSCFNVPGFGFTCR